MRPKISDAQRSALRMLARNDAGVGEIGRWPLGIRTVTALRRLGYTELHDATERSERFGYLFGRHSEYRTVPRAFERITDAGRKAIGL